MSSEELRWGIIGCGLISHDFVLSMKNCKTKNKIVAVAARNLEKAENFKTQTNLENSVVVYGSYDELLADKNVDIVYIGVVNHEHVPIGIKALEVGKPLLAEKPIGPNVKEAKKLFEKAKEKNLFLMEATWSRFSPVYQEIRKIIDEKTLGNVVGVNATFCLPWLVSGV
uniref:Gfo/Idh/MocA-like oxidoreductase N-terminal domain-containing protein n=1 Tax=Panagrolaimus sp. JU765 TaxID=591449 RepID=A0AC34R5Z6_9BILA